MKQEELRILQQESENVKARLKREMEELQKDAIRIQKDNQHKVEQVEIEREQLRKEKLAFENVKEKFQ